jgi:amino acid transporter
MSSDATNQGAGFGTFKGVFTPSILTILGVIMYLRLGWVLGNAGLVGTLVIVTLSSLVTFLTGLSIAATATNMRVGTGGAYYMISRSLGLLAGAAVGVPLYFAQALGVSFYVVGFAEAVHGVFPAAPVVGTGVIALIGLGVLAILSADLALKTQSLILGTIVFSLVCFFAGGTPDAGFAGAPPPPAELESFWVVFGVFFPAVTGIEAGVAMSGDLKDPAKSLPRGTLAAVGVGWAVYVVIPLALAAWVPREVLLADSMVMQRVAIWGPGIVAGVWGATLSSALGALLGAPRTLQALAKDRVVPRILGRGHGESNEPRIATAITFAVALVGVLAGDLNAIAPVLSMFFLTSYAFLNLSAGIEGLIGSPSWRPAFKTPWYVSLLGAAICIGIMLVLNTLATFGAAAVVGLVYYWTGRRRLRAWFGDVRRGILVLLARFAVYRLAAMPVDPRSWRPNFLVLSGAPKGRMHLVEFAHSVNHGGGFLTVAAILPATEATAARVGSLKAAISGYLDRHKIPALVDVHADDDVMAGAAALVQASGVGSLHPNTVILGISERPERRLGYAQLILRVHRLGRNLILMRHPDDGASRRERIDVWWGGRRRNAGLMLALGYLLQTSERWSGSRLRIQTIVNDDAEGGHALRRLDSLIDRGRIEATPGVVLREGRTPFDVIREASEDADLTLIGLRPPEPDETAEDYAAYYTSLLEMTDAHGATAYVLAAEDIDFLRIFE